MKVQVLTLGVLVSLVVLATGKPAEDADMAQRLLRSCDHNADNALNAAEFAGCLMGTSRQQRMASSKIGISRSELLQAFMDEADQNNDLRADEVELQEWSARWFLSDLFSGTISININQIIGKIVIVLQYISEERYSDAISELYVLVSGSQLSSSAKASVTLAITAIQNRRYGEAVGYVYAVIKEIAGGDEAGGIFLVSSRTVTNIASLLQAVIESDSDNINFYIYRSLAGLIVDFSFLSEESAGSVAALIQAVIENNSDDFYISLEAVIVTIEGISSETATALTELLETVVYGPSSQISVKILAVLSAVLEDDNAAEIASIFVAVIQAVIDGDSEEAIRQLTVLYAKITGSSNQSGGFSSTTVVAFAAIITALEDNDRDGAIAAVQVLIRRSRSEFTSSQIRSLEIIISYIEDNDYEEAIALLVSIATSGGTTGSSSVVEISVEVFIALSSVITIVEDSGSSTAAIRIIRELLSDSSITISSEVREALQILIIVISEESKSEILRVVAAIITGSSNAFGITLSSEVISEVELVIAALDDDDSRTAIAIIEALLDGDNGGDSLSIIVRNDFRSILIALRDDDQRSRAYALLTIVYSGSRSSSLSISATVGLFVAIEAISSGSSDYDNAVVELELLLDDDDLDSSFRNEIEIIIEYLEENRRSKAMTAIVISIIGTEISIEKSAAAILYAALRYAAAGDSEDAIEAIEEFIDEYSDSEIQFVLAYILRLLREENSQGALTIINTIIVEAFGDDCYCD